MSARILLIEDDPEMEELTAGLLTGKGYKVSVVHSGEEALAQIQRQPPDLVISDVQLPGLSGVRLCELLKSQPATASLPIILMTVLAREAEKVRGLERGADDYVTKPYSAKEFVARVEALLRRVNAQGRPANRIVHKDLALDLDKAVVTIKNKPVNLRRKEYELLVVLLQKRGHLLNRDFLTEAVWHSGDIVTSNTVSSHIKNLRAKLGAYGDCIETVVGLGYRFKDE